MASYTITGPAIGETGKASTNFTVTRDATLLGGAVTMIVTPSAGAGGGTFTPTTVNITDAAPTATFTYTPASVGTKTITATNDKGRTNPAALSYAVVASVATFLQNALWATDNSFGGVFKDDMEVAGIPRTEIDSVAAAYESYKKGRQAVTRTVREPTADYAVNRGISRKGR